MRIPLEPEVEKLVEQFALDKEIIAKYAPSRARISHAFLVNAVLFQILTKWNNRDK